MAFLKQHRLNMRRLFLLPLAALLIVGAGCRVTQEEAGEVPDVDVEGGELPEYDVEGPDVDVETEEREVTVPEIEVTPPGEGEEPAAE